MATIEITSKNFKEKVLNSDLPVLVDFWAPWCRPCLMMSPALEELSKEFEGKVKIGKMDVNNPENRTLALQYKIQSIPNMKLFRNGEVINDYIGLRSKEALKKDIEEELSLI
ncbi:thioredoxin [Candidatus Woesearchaeota archaeon]|nr:thioredoxin [Candidatus Woesearchaeota archaeon]